MLVHYRRYRPSRELRVDPYLAAGPNLRVHQAIQVAAAHCLAHRRLDHLGRSICG
jgi:hypothetical protein